MIEGISAVTLATHEMSRAVRFYRAPVAAKPSAMPPNERLRPDDLEDPNNRWKPAIQLDEEQAVTVGQPRSAPARAP